MAQRPFDRHLNQVVGIGRMPGQGAGEPPQARQQGDDAGTGCGGVDLGLLYDSTNGRGVFLRTAIKKMQQDGRLRR